MWLVTLISGTIAVAVLTATWGIARRVGWCAAARHYQDRIESEDRHHAADVQCLELTVSTLRLAVAVTEAERDQLRARLRLEA